MRINWFWLECIRSKLQRKSGTASAECSHHKNRSIGQRIGIADAPHDVNAVGTRHTNVGDYEIRFEEERCVVTPHTIFRDGYLVSILLEGHAHQLAHYVVVFNNQNLFGHSPIEKIQI